MAGSLKPEISYFIIFLTIDDVNYGPINIDPESMGGTPIFTGTRVAIQSLFDYIETGETLDEFYPAPSL